LEKFAGLEKPKASLSTEKGVWVPLTWLLAWRKRSSRNQPKTGWPHKA
jgi:hypothetical protein